MAEVDFGGVRKEVCLEYLPDATVGEYVIVHVGFAIQRLDEGSALETLAAVARMGLLAEELDGVNTDIDTASAGQTKAGQTEEVNR
jgi:hydrogenase expression/formation protein HypC